MATQTKQGQGNGLVDGLLSELPMDRLKDEVVELGKALAKRGAAKIGASLTGTGGKLGDLGDAVPGPGDMVKAGAKAAAKAASPVGAVKGAAGKVKDAIPGVGSDDDSDEDAGESGGKGKVASMDSTDLKVTNIVETIDVPVSREIAYDLWTQFEAFPAFMKKVEAVNQKDPEEVTWKAQIFWSHRTWKAKIIDQVPPEHIVWKSEGEKGHVDGAVTFHELAPDLTRVLLSLEYFPQGLFERTGNLWRAQGRRVRLELKHYRRFVANHALLQQDDVEGWEGEIHDGKVKRQRSSTAKKSSAGGSAARKSTSNGSTARKTAAKKSASGGSTAKKSTSASSTAKKSASGGSTAKKTAARKTASSGPAARKSTAKKAASGSPTAKKTAARKTASSGSTAKKTAARKSTSQRTAAAAKRTPTTTSRTSSTSGSSSRSRSTGSSGRRTGRSSSTRSKR